MSGSFQGKRKCIHFIGRWGTIDSLVSKRNRSGRDLMTINHPANHILLKPFLVITLSFTLFALVIQDKVRNPNVDEIRKIKSWSHPSVPAFWSSPVARYWDLRWWNQLFFWFDSIPLPYWNEDISPRTIATYMLEHPDIRHLRLLKLFEKQNVWNVGNRPELTNLNFFPSNIRT